MAETVFDLRLKVCS